MPMNQKLVRTIHEKVMRNVDRGVTCESSVSELQTMVLVAVTNPQT